MGYAYLSKDADIYFIFMVPRCHIDDCIRYKFIFPFDFKISESEQLYRYKTSRFAAGCLKAVFRYLFAYKAAPSLAIVLNYGIFYLIGGLLFAYQDGMAQKDMHHLLLVAFLVVVIWFELRQKTREDGGTFRRDYF